MNTRMVQIEINGIIHNGIYNVKAHIVTYGHGLYVAADRIIPYFLTKQAF